MARYIEALPGQSSGSHWGNRQVQSCRMGQDCKQVLIDRPGGDQRKDYLIAGQEMDQGSALLESRLVEVNNNMGMDCTWPGCFARSEGSTGVAEFARQRHFGELVLF